MRRAGITAVACVVAMLIASGAAWASRHGVPPKTVLHSGGKSQRGGLVWEDWTAPSGPVCVASSGDGPGTYPRPIRLGPGRHRAHFALFKRQRPSRVRITAWHHLNSGGHETGASETLARTLRPRRDPTGRIVRWVARFSVDLPPAYYIHLYVRWPDGKCGGPRHVLRTYSIAR